MVWKLEVSAKASKELGKLAEQPHQQILDYLTLQVLARDNPRDLGKALRHEKSGLWRYRVEKYRILCQIQDERLIILIIKVGKRDSVYA